MKSVKVDSKPPALEINLLQTSPGNVQLSWNSSDENLVFNRTVTLRDTWAKIQKQQKQKKKG